MKEKIKSFREYIESRKELVNDFYSHIGTNYKFSNSASSEIKRICYGN